MLDPNEVRNRWDLIAGLLEAAAGDERIREILQDIKDVPDPTDKVTKELLISSSCFKRMASRQSTIRPLR